MKNVSKKLLLLIFLSGMFIFLGCQNEEVINENQLNTNFKKNNTNSKIINGNAILINDITEKHIIKTKDGVILLFDREDNYYKDAISIIPHNVDEKNILNEFLNRKSISIEYRLDGIIYKDAKGNKLMFAVNNSKGIKLASTQKNITTYYCDQLAYAKRNKFSLNKFSGNVNEIATNDLITIIVGKFKGPCSSGGQGSTGCSIDDFTGGCSVSCGVGYYACCQSSNNTCICLTQKQ